MNLGRADGTIDPNDDALAAFRDSDAGSVDPYTHTFTLQDPADRRGDVRVLALDQSRTHLDDRPLAAEASIHLGEFEPDIAASDDHQMPRQKIDRHHRGVRQIRNLIEAWP